MAKKRKVRRKRKPASYMMVIRVAVPSRYVPALKVLRVLGATPGRMIPHDLEILNSYYDMPGVPGAH